MKEKLVEQRQAPYFYRVIMPLGELLGGDIFKEYIKIGELMQEAPMYGLSSC